VIVRIKRNQAGVRVAAIMAAVAALLISSVGAADLELLLDRAATFQRLGQQKRAVETLEEAVAHAEAEKDPAALLRAKSRLGAALILTRENAPAEKILRESLEASRESGQSQQSAAILNDLGNLLASDAKYDEASAAFTEAVTLAGADPSLLARILCNHAAASERAGDKPKAGTLNAQALDAVDRMADSEAKAFLLLTAALTDHRINAENLLARSHRSATRALEIAERLKDHAMMSHALRHLSQLYQQDRQLDHSVALARRAAFQAQQARLPDALFRAEWQAGRALRQQGQRNDAIAAYRRATEALEPIRHDLALGYGNTATSASFRQSLGPLFFELADLLLTQAAAENQREDEQRLLREARDTVEQLKAVELEDYFQDDCVNVARARSETVENVDPRSAVLYLIPLPDRTEVLVSLASGMSRFVANISADALETLVREFRVNLETRTTYAYLDEARELYRLIIRPAHGLLTENKIDTLVFVPDGALQTIPLASLHDGERFLIEEFAVAVTPGLSLVEPRAIERKKAQVLLSGLSEAVQGFPSLEFVPDELQQIETGYRSDKLLNESFVTSAIEEKLAGQQFSIVHIASHGQFDRDARNTFVLTYDGKLTLNNLEALIRPSQYRGRPVELLVLSACQTAAGDDRAALGLAGVAIKAGARSALASLWFVNDQSTAAFVSELYEQFQSPSISRAKAVQAAQMKMLEDRRYRHPCYWAPYLLIGNWL
jgi:CHAT domain-containing protein